MLKAFQTAFRPSWDTKTPLKSKLMKFFQGCQGDELHQFKGAKILGDITPLNKELITQINN